MSGYELVVFVHVLAAVVWVGGGAMLEILSIRARRSGPDRMRFFGEEAEWLSGRLFMPASFVTLAFGIWAVLIGPWSFSDVWITLGFVGLALTIVVGMGIIRPTAKRMAELSAQRGPQDPGVLQLSRRMTMSTRLSSVILIAVVFDMVVKPGA